jgi:hypothetical protein
VPRTAAWTVLALVFADELAALAGLAVYGASTPARWVLVWLLPLVGVTVWSLVASPKARYGGTVRRPVAKALVFGAACAGLWAAGHPGWAVGLLVFSVVVNALAQLPSVRAVAQQDADRT